MKNLHIMLLLPMIMAVSVNAQGGSTLEDKASKVLTSIGEVAVAAEEAGSEFGALVKDAYQKAATAGSEDKISRFMMELKENFKAARTSEPCPFIKMRTEVAKQASELSAAASNAIEEWVACYAKLAKEALSEQSGLVANGVTKAIDFVEAHPKATVCAAAIATVIVTGLVVRSLYRLLSASDNESREQK